MKKGQIYTGVVEKVDFPNKGQVRIEEMTDTGEKKVSYCTVKNVIEGQEVSIFVKKVRKGKGEGQLKEVTKAAPNQIESKCPHFNDCGGCTYQNLSYEDQALLKEKQVKELLDGVLCKQDIPYEFMQIKFSPAKTGYRNKMEFTFGDSYKDGPLAVGLHKRGSFYDIVSVNEEFSREKFIEKAAITMACRMSIKANDYISYDDQVWLLDALRKTKNPFTCPHGRPTIITYTKYDLEKLFKRSID